MMTSPQKIVTAFGGSRPQPGDEEYQLAYDLGAALGKSGFILCNGGFGGTMEATARGAKSAGGKTVGVISDFFAPRKGNPWIDETISSDSLISRLLKLVELGDAYVVLKGGTGTLLELAAVWEFMNKNVIPHKPIIVLGDFWEDVVTTLQTELSWEGMDDCTRFVIKASSPDECVRLLNERFFNHT